MKVINILGGPCSGKSTTAAGLYYKMKLQHMRVELVTEVAKDLTYDDRIQFRDERQEWIFAEQHLRLKRVEPHVDYAIIDSPLLLSLVYPRADWEVLDTFHAFVWDVYQTFDNIVFFLDRPDTYQQYGRSQDLDAAMLVDDKTRAVMAEYEIPHHWVKTGPDVVDEILGLVLNTEHET